MILRDFLGIMFAFILIISPTISDAFAENQTEDKISRIMSWSFDNPFFVITVIGFLSLIISLIVFSANWQLRGKESRKLITIEKIKGNLKELKDTLGEPSFTNLLNGLSSAAKEEIVFPEPVGVLRHKEFRRALTVSVTLTYFAILGFSTVADSTQAENFNNNPIVQAFAWVFVAVIAFYFGDKIFENYVKSKGVQVTANVLEPIVIEEATINKTGTKLTIKIKNNLKSKIKITKIDVDDTDVDKFNAFEIDAKKLESRDYSIKKGGKTVKIEVGQVTVEKETKMEE